MVSVAVTRFLSGRGAARSGTAAQPRQRIGPVRRRRTHGGRRRTSRSVSPVARGCQRKRPGGPGALPVCWLDAPVRAVGRRWPRGRGSAPPAATPLVTRSDERRIATVLFADLVGFTSLSESLDPEQVKNLVDALLRAPGARRHLVRRPGRQDRGRRHHRPVRRAGGPRGRRRAGGAGRAAHAGDACRPTGPTRAPRCELRIGVNTGEVLVGALRAGGDYTAMGDVVNTAQRLQTAAEPGTVVVGSTCHAATSEAIAYQALGSVEAKGRDEPIEAWTAVEPLLPPGHRPRRVQTPVRGPRRRAGRAGQRRRRRRRAAARPSAPADRRGRRGQVPPGRGGGRGGPLPPRRQGVRGPLRALRRGQRVVADRRGPAPGLRHRRPTACWPRPSRRPLDAVADALGQAVDTPEVKRVANGLLFLMGYEVAAARDRSPAGPRGGDPGRCWPSSRRLTSTQPVVLVLSDLHWADDLVLELVATPGRPARPPPVRAGGHRPPGRHRALDGAHGPPQHGAGQPRPARPGRHRRAARRAGRRRGVGRDAGHAARPQRRQPVLPGGAGGPGGRRHAQPRRRRGRRPGRPARHPAGPGGGPHRRADPGRAGHAWRTPRCGAAAGRPRRWP